MRRRMTVVPLSTGLLVGALLLATPGALACDPIATPFVSAAWVDHQTLVVTDHNRVELVPLDSEPVRVLAEDWFPRVVAQPGQGIANTIQEGLGADCSGTEYVEVRTLSGDLLHRHHALGMGPLASSPQGFTSGVQEVHFVSWDEPDVAHRIDLDVPPDDRHQRWAVSLHEEGSLFAVASDLPPVLHVMDLDTGASWVEGMTWRLAEPLRLESTPAVAFEPAGERLVAHATAEGKDRLWLLDVAKGADSWRLLLDTPVAANEAGRAYPASVDWSSEGLVVAGHGQRVIALVPDGDAFELRLEEQEWTAQVVAHPENGRWAVFTVKDWRAERIIVFEHLQAVGEARLTVGPGEARGWNLDDTQAGLQRLQEWDESSEEGPNGSGQEIPSASWVAIFFVLAFFIFVTRTKRT